MMTRKRTGTRAGAAAPGLALVTGASAGIGREMARVFARHGHDLVVVARRRNRLLELKRELEHAHAVRVRILEADLADPATPGAIRRSLARRQVEILVNNAGTLEGGAFVGLAPDRLEAMLQLNVGALTRMTREFLPAMIRRGRGRILNVASIAAFAPVPWLGVYAATKSYVLSFSEALATELEETSVSVTALCPGLTDSEMADAALARARDLARFRNWLFAPARDVAEAAYAGCMAGEALVIPGVSNRLYGSVVGLTPRAARRRLTRLFGAAMR